MLIYLALRALFKPRCWWRNRHLQTAYPALFCKPPTPTRRTVILTTTDDDELLLDISGDHHQSKHAMLLFHDLGGSSDSQYIVALQSMVDQMGIMSVAVNFRGAKGPNRLAKAYHSGVSDEAREAVEYCNQHFDKKWLATGFSLGGN